MLLGKPLIERHWLDGNITIDPFVPANLGSAQYDVSLGRFCYRETLTGPISVYNPYDELAVRAKWAIDRAVPHEDLVTDRFGVPFVGIGPKEEIILVRPGETILAHTEEFIGGSCNFITTMMKARSSLGRNFIEVCKCAGMGDVGYFNRWTMEITNNSQYHTLPLVCGRRIAQILFFEVAPVAAADRYDQGGKYQSHDHLEDLKAAWTPESMLPKQWRDREVRELQQKGGL